MTEQSGIPAAGGTPVGIDLAAPSAVPPSMAILITSAGTASAGSVTADVSATGTVNVYGAGGTAASESRRPRRPQNAPDSMSDLDMLAWVTGRSIRNKELFVPFADED